MRRTRLCLLTKGVSTVKSANNFVEIREAALRGDIVIGPARRFRPSSVFSDIFDVLNVGPGAMRDRQLSIDQRSKLVELSKPSIR